VLAKQQEKRSSYIKKGVQNEKKNMILQMQNKENFIDQ